MLCGYRCLVPVTHITGAGASYLVQPDSAQLPGYKKTTGSLTLVSNQCQKVLTTHKRYFPFLAGKQVDPKSLARRGLPKAQPASSATKKAKQSEKAMVGSYNRLRGKLDSCRITCGAAKRLWCVEDAG